MNSLNLLTFPSISATCVIWEYHLEIHGFLGARDVDRKPDTRWSVGKRKYMKIKRALIYFRLKL